MRSIKATEFKAKCLSLMDEVERTGEPIVVTKHGRAVVRVVPERKKPKTIFGFLKGEIEITGDIMSPLDEEWDALK
jgi:prevent-host-death family protein